MDDTQLLDSPREGPALTFVQFADDPLESLVRAVRTTGHTTECAPGPPSHQTRQCRQCRLTLAQPLGESLLVERENRVNPGGSQRWNQARECGNHNEEQRCSRYAYGVRWTDTVQQRRDQRGRGQGDDEAGGDPR